MRHGEASPPASDDFSRPLTRQGELEVNRACEQLSLITLEVSRVLASPLIRAQQTAAIAIDCLGLSEFKTTQALIPSAACAEVAALLDDGTDIQLVVTHQPFASMFVEYLTGEELYMDTATIAGIRVNAYQPGCADLDWFIEP